MIGNSPHTITITVDEKYPNKWNHLSLQLGLYGKLGTPTKYGDGCLLTSEICD